MEKKVKYTEIEIEDAEKGFSIALYFTMKAHNISIDLKNYNKKENIKS